MHADNWSEAGKVRLRLHRQRPAGCEVIYPTRWTGVVGREEDGNAIAVVQLAQIGRAGDDVVVRVVKDRRPRGAKSCGCSRSATTLR